MMMKFLPCMVAVAHGFASTSSESIRNERQGAFDGKPALGPNGDNECGVQNTGIDLGTASEFAILAQSGISMIPSTAITGDIGVSPISATAITGFSLAEDSSGAYSTTVYVAGNVYYPGISDYKMTTAVGDMGTAYTNAAGRARTEVLIPGLLTGVTLYANNQNNNVYSFTEDILIASGGTLTLSGDSCSVFIIRTTKNVVLGSGASVSLVNGVHPSNVFWQVAGSVTVGTTGLLAGNVLAYTHVVLETGATLNGRILTQTATTLDQATVNQPTGWTRGQSQETDPFL
jgi:hypothetical protein